MAWAWDAVATTTPLAGLIAAINRRLTALAAAVTASDQRGVGIGTIPPGAHVPSVAGRSVWVVRNVSELTLSNFREGQVGQRVTLWFGDANTTLVHSTTFVLIGGVNYTPPAGRALAFVTVDGTTWTEVGR